MSQSAHSAVLPVAIIGGFLGAGKTTLLNRVLSSDHGLRIGVIVNDFGSLAFDEELAGASSSHQRLLANGCVCCSIENDLIDTVTELLGQDPPLDAVILEASGIADPVSLIATLDNPGMKGLVRVKSVVTVADAGRLREQEQDYGGELVLKQLRAASVIVLNKCDLVDPPSIAELHAWLGEIGARGAVFDAVQCDVPLEVVIGNAEQVDLMAPSPSDAEPPRFAEWTMQTETAFSAEQLEDIFAQLPSGIVRAKGVVKLPDEDGRLLVQFSGGLLNLSSVPAETNPTRAGTRIVMIGAPEAVDPPALEQLFR